MNNALEPYESIGWSVIGCHGQETRKRADDDQDRTLRGTRTDYTEKSTGNGSTCNGAKNDETEETSCIATRMTLQKGF